MNKRQYPHSPEMRGKCGELNDTSKIGTAAPGNRRHYVCGHTFSPARLHLIDTGGHSVDNKRSEKILQVDGHEVSINFADNPNPAVINQVKQILLASFIANTSKPQSSGILAI